MCTYIFLVDFLLMVLFPLNCLLVIVSSTNVIIVYTDARDNLFVDGVLLNRVGNTTSIRLTLLPMNFYSSFISAIVDTGFTRITFPGSNLVMQRDEFMNHVSTVSSLVIGPRSGFVYRHGSVSLIKNYSNTELLMVTGASRAEFETRYCVPGSLISISYNDGEYVILARSGSASVPLSLSFINSVERPWIMSTVPDVIFSRIQTVIVEGGGSVLGTDFLEYFNCRPDILHSLPDLHIDFIHNGSDLGRIVMIPEDYLIFDLAENTCRLKLRSSATQEQPYLNTLVMRGINTRFAENTIDICDTSL